LDKEPFGEHVEGLSYRRHKSYAIEREVQTNDFEEAAFRGGICPPMK